MMPDANRKVALVEKWLLEILGAPPPPERLATCQSCAMCAPPGAQVTYSPIVFRPDTKCCTYWPYLSNFLVGAILQDDESVNGAARAALFAAIRSADTVSPLGIGPSLVHETLYSHLGKEAFGRQRVLRCPYYVEESGICGIWQHRNHVCATYFCKVDRGIVGERFWSSVQHLLGVVEQELAVWSARQMGLDCSALVAAMADDRSLSERRTLSGTVEPEARAALWGNWVGREEELFLGTARLVYSLSWRAIREICGPRASAWSDKAVADHAVLLDAATLPRNPRVGAFRVMRADDRSAVVTTYSGTDPREISRELLDALPSFDGRPLELTLAGLANSRGITLSSDLVRSLWDLGLLVETKAGAGVDRWRVAPGPRPTRTHRINGPSSHDLGVRIVKRMPGKRP